MTLEVELAFEGAVCGLNRASTRMPRRTGRLSPSTLSCSREAQPLGVFRKRAHA